MVTVDGTFDLSAATVSDGTGTDTETIGGLAGTEAAAVVNVGANTLGCTAQLAHTVYSGGFQGTDAFRQSTSGVQVFSGTSFPYSGTTTLAGGSIHIWDEMLNSPVVVTGGTLVLASNCSVGDVTLSGSSSVLSLFETISAMTLVGTTPTLTIGSGSTYQVVAKSASENSQVKTTVGASINDAILSVDTSLHTPGVGSVMTIILNSGPGAISGTFAGLLEGATVTSATNSGTTFTISYTGGSGNDVTLTEATPDTTAPVITAPVTPGSATQSTVTVTWTTDELSTSRLDYGPDTAYGTSIVDTRMVTAHSVMVTGLTASTTYQYQVRSTDAAGNSFISTNSTFTTSNSSGVGGSGGTTGTLASNDDDNGCGAGSALGLLAMVGLLMSCQLQASRRAKRD